MAHSIRNARWIVRVASYAFGLKNAGATFVRAIRNVLQLIIDFSD